MSNLFRAYNTALVRRPYFANCATSATLFAAGDLLAQQGIEQKGLGKHDWARTARLTTFGGFVFGPFATTWYRLLGRLPIPDSNKLFKIPTSVALDQMLFASANVAVFHTSLALMEGKGVDGAKKRLDDAYWSTLTMNWKVWAPVQLVNFALTPPPLRLVVVNVVALFWNSYLSWISGAVPKDVVVGPE